MHNADNMGLYFSHLEIVYPVVEGCVGDHEQQHRLEEDGDCVVEPAAGQQQSHLAEQSAVEIKFKIDLMLITMENIMKTTTRLLVANTNVVLNQLSAFTKQLSKSQFVLEQYITFIPAYLDPVSFPIFFNIILPTVYSRST